MAHYLSDAELERTIPADATPSRSPVPTQIVSNGEFNPLPQTRDQRHVEARVNALADALGQKHGLNRRRFLASTAGMAAAFLAMNEVFGRIFDVDPAEAATAGVADERARALAGQFIIDAQTHFVRDDYNVERLLGFGKYAKQHWNPALVGENTLARYKFENYVKEIFADSDTKIALLSAAPFDDPNALTLSNDQIAQARSIVNRIAGSRRLLGHAVVTPKKAGWMDDVDRAITVLAPDSWKGYSVGSPGIPTKLGSYWWLDDEKLAYPFYEKIVKAGITTVCIHKGLLPADYEKSWPGVWEVRHGPRRRQGGQGLAAGQLRHLSRGAATLPRDTGRGASRVRADGPHQVGDRPRGDPGEVRRDERLRRDRLLLRQLGCRQPALRGGVHRHAGAGHGRRARRVGDGFRLVRIAAVADRSHASARDSRRHAQEARVRAARARRWSREDGHLRDELGSALSDRCEGCTGCRHTRQHRRHQGRISRDGGHAE